MSNPDVATGLSEEVDQGPKSSEVFVGPIARPRPRFSASDSQRPSLVRAGVALGTAGILGFVPQFACNDNGESPSKEDGGGHNLVVENSRDQMPKCSVWSVHADADGIKFNGMAYETFSATIEVIDPDNMVVERYDHSLCEGGFVVDQQFLEATEDCLVRVNLGGVVQSYPLGKGAGIPRRMPSTEPGECPAI